MWLRACVRYWPDLGLVFECVTCFYCCYVFIFLLDQAYEVPFANMKIKCQSWPEMPLILERSGTQCVAMVTKLLSSNCGAHLIDHTVQNQTIGPLHDPVTWYGINYAATQITQWGFQNKGKSGWTGNASPPGYVINNAKCNTNRKCNKN